MTNEIQGYDLIWQYKFVVPNLCKQDIFKIATKHAYELLHVGNRKQFHKNVYCFCYDQEGLKTAEKDTESSFLGTLMEIHDGEVYLEILSLYDPKVINPLKAMLNDISKAGIKEIWDDESNSRLESDLTNFPYMKFL